MRHGRIQSRVLCITAFAAIFEYTGAAAAKEASFAFENRQVTMIVGFAPGGGTDAVGRLIANNFTKHLPGHPPIVIRNMPGANGITAMNYMVQQVKPDGLTLTMGASQSDPAMFRRANAKYDPSKFLYIGGVGRGGTTLVINMESEKRLYDTKA